MGTTGKSTQRPGLRLAEPVLELRPYRSRHMHPSSNGAGRGPILYVSGSAENRVLFSRMARRWKPLRLLVADSTQAGLRLSEVRHLCLVVLDAARLDGDVADVVTRLRTTGRMATVPILVLSDDTSPRARARSMWAGANAVVPMPFNVVAIERTMHHLLASVTIG